MKVLVKFQTYLEPICELLNQFPLVTLLLSQMCMALLDFPMLDMK